MRNRFFCYNKSGILAAHVLAVVLLALLLPSCRHTSSSCHGDDERYAQLDSLMAGIGDVDSLEAMVRQSHEQNDKMSEMLALRYQGDLLRANSRYDEAITAHNRCVKIAESQCDTIEMAFGLYQLGEDFRRQGNMSEANGCYIRVLKLCDSFNDQDDDDIIQVKALALSGAGKIDLDLNNYTEADSVFREALWREVKQGRSLGIAVNYASLGRVKRDLGEMDSAWYYLRKALEYNQLAGNDVGVALCHLHFGELHESENRFSHALKEYKVAYDSLKESGDSWHWLDACLALAHAHILLGEVDAAYHLVTEAEIEAERIGSKEYQAESHQVHYELSLLLGDPQEALLHYVRSTELMDSIYGRQKTDEMRSQRNEYLKDRMSGEMDVLNRDISQLKRTTTMQLIFGLLLLLMACGIIAALVYAVRVRNRSQRLMHQVEETRSLFFTNVVHQLRTPLSAIMGAIDSMIAENTKNSADNTSNDFQRENYEIIERQGNNLLELVERILEVGSVRSAITDLDWRTCDAVTFMHMVLDTYRDRCLERHIELTYAPRESSVDIDTVPRYLSTIVTSLIENAINYSNEFGKITVTTRVDDGKFIIRVADNGMGISKDDLPHVFEPFYRGATAESMVDGVGIGLTVVRDMTMAMGGTVAADSMKDHGSVFTVQLPCRRPGGLKQRFDAATEPLMRKVKRQQRHRQEQKPTRTVTGEDLPVVLVVEDHSDVAHLVGFVLGDGYNVHYASDGEQGLVKAEELVPDLIITDVKMPLMSGLEMCRKLRCNRRLCHVPVIMLSARNSDKDRVRGIEAGADAYLVKPFVTEELRAWVNRLLENHRVLRDVFMAPEEPQQAMESQVGQTGNAGQDAAIFLKAFDCEVEEQLENGGKIDFDVIARSFKMGESQLRRKVQELTGKNIPAYIGQLRMEKAMRLLQNSSPDTLISTISEKCGFQDVAYFSRVFRQYYGMTPTQARNAAK